MLETFREFSLSIRPARGDTSCHFFHAEERITSCRLDLPSSFLPKTCAAGLSSSSSPLSGGWYRPETTISIKVTSSFPSLGTFASDWEWFKCGETHQFASEVHETQWQSSPLVRHKWKIGISITLHTHTSEPVRLLKKKHLQARVREEILSHWTGDHRWNEEGLGLHF